MSARPPLEVTVFSDYICPFCYIGSRRLLRLRDDYALTVHWRGIEIHPQTPATGMPIERLGYGPGRWKQMMEALQALAEEEGIRLREHDFTTNSRGALRLAEAAKEAGPKAFYTLHERLFAAFHTEGRNIGEAAVLRELGEEAGLPEALIDRALAGETYDERLHEHLRAAAAIGLTGTPTYLIGRQTIVGTVPLADLRRAARATLEATAGPGTP